MRPQIFDASLGQSAPKVRVPDALDQEIKREQAAVDQSQPRVGKSSQHITAFFAERRPGPRRAVAGLANRAPRCTFVRARRWIAATFSPGKPDIAIAETNFGEPSGSTGQRAKTSASALQMSCAGIRYCGIASGSPEAATSRSPLGSRGPGDAVFANCAGASNPRHNRDRSQSVAQLPRQPNDRRAVQH